MKSAFTAVAAILLAASSACPCAAGPVLDDLLNYPVVDQYSPEKLKRPEEGLKLVVGGGAVWANLRPGSSLGQTFVTGAKAERLWTIFVGLCHWPDSWKEGDVITFSLYDSPDKSKLLYSRSVDFEHKWFKWDVPFNMDVPVKPNSTYYFEITMQGKGDHDFRVTVSKDDTYTKGAAYVDGKPRLDFDLTFVTVTKNTPNTQENRKRLLDRFDFKRSELARAKKARDKGDFEGCCRLIAQAFDKRLEKDKDVWLPKPGEKIDIRRADAVARQEKYYDNKELTGPWIPMNASTTWREVWPGTAEYVRHNNLFRMLGWAYLHTKDEAYAKKLNDLMADFIQDNNSPFYGGMWGGRWVAMFWAWRLGDAWDGWAGARGSKGFTADVKLAWLDFLSRTAEFSMKEYSGANQANAVAEALISFGVRFPELKASAQYKSVGINKLIENSMDLFRDDGGSKERAMNYQGYAQSTLKAGILRAKENGIAIPEKIYPKWESALSFHSYMAMPNGAVVSYGDTNCMEFRPGKTAYKTSEPMEGYKRFGRKDLLYIATQGKQGVKPKQPGYAFPDTGFYIMRSDWGTPGGNDYDQARYLLLMGGHFGGHSHWDLNQIVLYAYGRPLIIDPGRTTYGTALMSELEKPRSHNVLLVDDLPMRAAEPTVHNWNTSALMDIIDNGYKNLYDGVDHRRAVVFVRPDYYVMFDEAASPQPHKVGINFWLTPPDPQIIDSGSVKRIFTRESSGANVCLDTGGSGDIEIILRKGTLDIGGSAMADIPVATFWQKAEGKAGFVTVIYPYPKGNAPAHEVSIMTDAEKGIYSASITRGDEKDVVSWSPGGQAGQASFIRTKQDKGITCFAASGAKFVKVKGQQLLDSPEPVAGLNVRYTDNEVIVDWAKPVPGARVWSAGRTRAIVNGKPKPTVGDLFKVY